MLMLLLAAAPDAESVGSVDGPFIWMDARGSAAVTSIQSEAPASFLPLAGMFASGWSILGQGQLFGGWGFRVLNRRLSLTAALIGTGVVSDAYLTDGFSRTPRHDVAPLLITTAMTLPFDGLVLVPMLGVTLPTRDGFGSDPVITLQPQV